MCVRFIKKVKILIFMMESRHILVVQDPDELLDQAPLYHYH